MSSTNSNIIIAPSILTANMGELTKEALSLQNAGADYIHVDVMDGQFVPPITFGDNVVALLRSQTKLFLDVHLMINNPERQLEVFKNAGADRIIVHAETCPHLHRTLSSIRCLGIESGVAFNPGTPAEHVFDVLDVADLVLVMTVNPGWGGQKLIPSCLAKVRQVRNKIERRKLNINLEVDGGVDAESIKLCAEAGANVFVAGSAVFKYPDRGAIIKLLRTEATRSFKQ